MHTTGASELNKAGGESSEDKNYFNVGSSQPRNNLTNSLRNGAMPDIKEHVNQSKPVQVPRRSNMAISNNPSYVSVLSTKTSPSNQKEQS